MPREGERRDILPGVHAKLVHESVTDGLWVIYLRLEPGTRLAPHVHTANVHFLTTKGAWVWRHENGSLQMISGRFVDAPAGPMPAVETQDGVELFLHITALPERRGGEVVTLFSGNGWTDRLLRALRRKPR